MSVVLHGLRKVFEDGTVAVQGADLAVREGEFLVLVGPSGCGKSTTLRMIAGLETITEGSVAIDGERVNDLAPKDRNIAMVFQNYALYPHMSVFDNMSFGLRMRKVPKGEIQERVQKAATILGLEDILDRKPGQLSGGQQQRVAVGRAIVRNPSVFLFDEPLSNLDAKLRVQMRMELSRLHRQLGTTMIYVTHDQVEAMTMGDRIVVMRDGFIEQIDSPLKLYHEPANRFVAGFIGSPTINFLEGRVRVKGAPVFEANVAPLSFVIDGQSTAERFGAVDLDVTMGFRPDDLSIHGTGDIPKGFLRLDATVELLEPMGNETIVYARFADQSITARVTPEKIPLAGQRVSLLLDTRKAHFFDAFNHTRL